MEAKIYEQAIRSKMRFITNKGCLSMEDLWDLSLESLDALAIGYNNESKSSESGSFIGKKSTASEVAKLKFDIVKHIIDVKIAERDAAETAVEKKNQKQRILQLIADKEHSALAGKSKEELEQLLKDLD